MNKDQLSILIVEDQALIAEDMRICLEEFGYAVAAVCHSGEEALMFCKKEQPDLILMDIELAGMLDGIETVSTLKKFYQIPVIYLTNFDDKATLERAKETHPANYLLKPFQPLSLRVSIEMAIHHIANNIKPEPIENQKGVDEDGYILKDAVFIKTDKRFHKILLNNILRIKADRAYSHIITANKKYTIAKNLSTICKQIEDPRFYRISRSDLINLEAIEQFEGNMIYIKGEMIRINKDKKDEIFQQLNIIR